MPPGPHAQKCSPRTCSGSIKAGPRDPFATYATRCHQSPTCAGTRGSTHSGTTDRHGCQP
eukprot:1253173-Pyramimonas_sp.AAC.1